MGDAVEEIDSLKIYSYALFMEEKEMVMNYSHEDFRNDVVGRYFHHGRFIQCMCEAVADLSIVTVLEVIGKKFVNDDNDSGVDKETVCGVQ